MIDTTLHVYGVAAVPDRDDEEMGKLVIITEAGIMNALQVCTVLGTIYTSNIRRGQFYKYLLVPKLAIFKNISSCGHNELSV